MKTFTEKFKSLPRYSLYLAGTIIAFILFIYYPVGMVWVNKIDDSKKFAADTFDVQGGSYTVSMAAALIDREVNQHHWVSNDPFFLPGGALIRMPAFQRGILMSVSRFAVSMSDYVGRARGSSQIDTDLQNATSSLKYSPYVWFYNRDVSWLPTASSAKQYQSGMNSLIKYNERLAKGQADFEHRADNLIAAMDGMASDIGSASAAIDTYVTSDSSDKYHSAAELFYFNKGLLYGNYMLLRELGRDYADVIKDKQMTTVWADMLATFAEGMRLRNFMIFNASPNSQFFPNHLTSQGFYLLRARTQMREVTNILLK